MDNQKTINLTLSLGGDVIKVSAQESSGEEAIEQYQERTVNLDAIRELAGGAVGALLNVDEKGCFGEREWKSFRERCAGLYDGLLTSHAKQVLARTDAAFLQVSMDDNLVHVPWELLYDGQQFLAHRFAVGRRVQTRQPVFQVAHRRIHRPERMLILADPTGDLHAAYEEGHALLQRLKPYGNMLEVDAKFSSVDLPFVQERLKSYDIVHYAGHAEHNVRDPQQSAWVLQGGRLTAADIVNLGGGKAPPSIVFCNACESGRTGQWTPPGGDLVRSVHGLANAFLLAGVRHYIGAFVDLRDDKASALFAETFFERLLEGETVGEALLFARQQSAAKFSERSAAWASYVLYGPPASRPFPKTNSTTTSTTTVTLPPPPPIGPREELVSPGRPAGAVGRRPRRKEAMVLAGAVAILLGAGWSASHIFLPPAGPIQTSAVVGTNTPPSPPNVQPPPQQTTVPPAPTSQPIVTVSVPEPAVSGYVGAAKLTGESAEAWAQTVQDCLVEAVRQSLPSDLSSDPEVKRLLQDSGGKMLQCQQYVLRWQALPRGTSDTRELKVQAQVARNTPDQIRSTLLQNGHGLPDLKTLYRTMGSPRILVDIRDQIEGFPSSGNLAQSALVAALRDLGFDVRGKDDLRPIEKPAQEPKPAPAGGNMTVFNAPAVIVNVDLSGKDVADPAADKSNRDALQVLYDDYGIQLVIAGSCVTKLQRQTPLYPGLPTVSDYRTELYLHPFMAPTGWKFALQHFSDYGMPRQMVGAADRGEAVGISVGYVTKTYLTNLFGQLAGDWFRQAGTDTPIRVSVSGFPLEQVEQLQQYLKGLGHGIEAIPEARKQFTNGVSSFEIVCRRPRPEISELLPSIWLETVSAYPAAIDLKARAVAEGRPKVGDFAIVLPKITQDQASALADNIREAGVSISRRWPTKDGVILEIESGQPLGELAQHLMDKPVAAPFKVVTVAPPWIFLAAP
jgi:hypothetical protein